MASQRDPMVNRDVALVDYHCHLDLYPDCVRQFAACTQQAIATLAVTTTPRAWTRNKEMAAASAYVRVGLGMHPHLVGTGELDIRLFERLLPESRFVGEIGLDAGPSYYRHYQEQKMLFDQILRLCGAASGKILSIHSVRSAKDVLQGIEQHIAPSKCRAVLHWFTGSSSDARRAVSLGCYFSVNAPMLAKPEIAKFLAVVPKGRLLTETDGPFTLSGTAPARPADVARTVTRLAALLNLDEFECRALLRNNLSALEDWSEIG